MGLRKRLPEDERELELIRFPADDGVPMEDSRHGENAQLLRSTLEDHLKARGVSVFGAGNNFIYYDRTNPRHNVGPDFYAVLDPLPNPDRDCWRVWNEDFKLPQVIVEFLSKTSRVKDYKTNFVIYQDTLKVPDYFIYDFKKRHLDGWERQDGVYVPLSPDSDGRLQCASLNLKIGLHDGWLRWFTLEGTLLPTGSETAARVRHVADLEMAAAEQARINAEQARVNAEQARAKAEQRAAEAEALVAQLREQLRCSGLEDF